MEKNRLEIFNKRLNKARNDFKILLNDKNNKKDKLEELKKIIDECNIIEDYNIEYLKILKEFEEEEIFKLNLLKYEGSISEKKINENFPKIIVKISALDKIKLLITKILNLNSLTIKEREEEVKDILSQIKKIKLYKLNIQLFPSDNMELYIFLIYQMFCGNISNKIKEFKIDSLIQYKKDEDKKYDLKLLKEINEMIEKSKVNKDIKFQDEIKSQIKIKIDNYEIFQIVHNSKFNDYLNGFYKFYDELNINIVKRFFEKEKFNEEDVKLFEQFTFFLSNYEFQNLKDEDINIWKESLEELSIEEIKEKIEDLNKLFEKKIKFIN